MATIAVIDYGMGNLHSIAKALNKVTSDRISVTYDPEEVLRADRVVFPGVGGIAYCMGEMGRLGLDEAVREVCASERPLLGICVGMQALMRHSEENGGVDGLDILNGVVQRLQPVCSNTNQRLKVPHMGWNTVLTTEEHPVLDGVASGERYYFVHSYAVDSVENDPSREPLLVYGRTSYSRIFASATGKDNVFAVQFHPEKSGQAGLALLHNFCRWDGKVND